MKRITKVVIALALCFSMLFATACSGGEKKEENSEKTLHVAAVNKGYGIDWLEAMLEDFCEDTGWEYVLYPYYDDSVATQKIESGIEACNYDIVFTGSRQIASTKYLMELSDVLNSQIESGTRAGLKISECIDPTVFAGLEDADEEGKYYKMPWTGGINGLLFNNAAITKALGADWQEQYPCRTTNELLEFCEACKKAGLAPFIHSAVSNYYSFLYEGWFAQYNGTEGMKEYFNGRYTNFLGEQTVGYDVSKNAGVLESVKVMESIFANGYSHEKSNAIDGEVTQTLFMTGEAAMISNGDWHQLEMQEQFPESDIRFMKLPIISALGTKLGITEEQLIALVDYVDGNGEKPEISTGTYTAEQLVEIVKDARSWVSSYADAFNVYIPSYSVNGETAKEFLKYMVSDEGQHIFSEVTQGLTMCYGYDLSQDAIFSELSEFAASRWEIATDAQYYIYQRGEAWNRAGLHPFRAIAKAPLEVLLSRTEDRYTAQMIYDYDYDYFKSNWSQMQNQVK